MIEGEGSLREGAAPRIYRAMKIEQGQPKLDNTGKGLGVRVPLDIEPVDDVVSPQQAQGMSVTPAPQLLPAHRVRRELRHVVPGAKGPSDIHIWRMGDGPFVTAPVAPDLVLEPDPPLQGKVRHGVVAPDRQMPLSVYEAALAATRQRWVLAEEDAA
jgi:hypothetical protein